MAKQRNKKQRRHSDAERRSILAAFAASGQSQARFAERQGISTTTLQNWLRVARASRGGGSLPELVPVRVRDARDELALGSEPKCFEITLRSQRRLLVPSGFEAQEVRLLVEILEARC
jgi:transposase-like protein